MIGISGFTSVLSDELISKAAEAVSAAVQAMVEIYARYFIISIDVSMTEAYFILELSRVRSTFIAPFLLYVMPSVPSALIR